MLKISRGIRRHTRKRGQKKGVKNVRENNFFSDMVTFEHFLGVTKLLVNKRGVYSKKQVPFNVQKLHICHA